MFFSVASQVMQKYVALQSNKNSKPSWRQPLFWCAMASLGLSMVFWLFVLHTMEVGKAYPILSVNYVLMLLISWAIFKEHIPITRIVGLLIIVLGVIIVGIS
ncbi:MAG: EamA family transporter [Gammaproteobacteria bacterium]|nr:EamA family transporter [Gammaproteobacteria bacterium]MBU1831212.1 EamA family transporter [Gammaproteobacteria bacterium]